MTFGPNHSDLPLGTVYPFYAIAAAKYAKPAALTIYCDHLNISF